MAALGIPLIGFQEQIRCRDMRKDPISYLYAVCTATIQERLTTPIIESFIEFSKEGACRNGILQRQRSISKHFSIFVEHFGLHNDVISVCALKDTLVRHLNKEPRWLR